MLAAVEHGFAHPRKNTRTCSFRSTPAHLAVGDDKLCPPVASCQFGEGDIRAPTDWQPTMRRPRHRASELRRGSCQRPTAHTNNSKPSVTIFCRRLSRTSDRKRSTSWTRTFEDTLAVMAAFGQTALGPNQTLAKKIRIRQHCLS